MSLFLSTKRIDKFISSKLFLLKAWKFIDRKEMKFSSPKEARKFLTFFLLVICLNEEYSHSELKKTYRKIKKYVKNNQIFSKLPVKQQRYWEELDNVEYKIVDSTCSYEKKPAV